MVECAPPQRLFRSRIAAVALIGDDQVESMDGYVEAVAVFFDVRIGDVQDRLPRLLAEEIDRHALDRRYVNEGMAGLWLCEVVCRQHLWIELLVVAEVAH